MTLWDKYIHLNTFESDIISDAIGDYQLDFYFTRDIKGDSNKLK